MMSTMKRMLLVLLVLCVGRLAHAQYVAAAGNCELPGQAVVVSGLAQAGTQPLAGTPFTTGSGVMASYPQCLVTVFPPGSSTPVAGSSVFSNATGTTLGNPFVANTDGSWVFYVTNGCYDVLMSSGGSPAGQMPITKTLSGKCAGQSSVAGSGTVNTGTAGQVAYYPATAPAVSGDTRLTDSGVQLGYTGSSGFSLPGDGTHPGAVGLVGNTTLPTALPTTNFAGDIGPNSTSFTAWFTQRNATAPTAASVFGLGAATGTPGVSQQNIIPLQGTDTNVPTSGTFTGATGTGVCKDANGGISTVGCTPSGGGGNPTLDNCTPDETGNSIYTVTSLTNYFNAAWQFVFNTTTYFDCTVYVATAQTGATVVVDVWSSDSTAGHTASITYADGVINSGTMNTGSLTSAANQTFTTTSTANNRATLTFNVQSTLSNGSILVVKIGTAPSGTAPTANLNVYPHFVL
jgi:hypothetical protein